MPNPEVELSELPDPRDINRHFLKMLILFIIIVGVAFYGYEYWDGHLSPLAKENAATEANYSTYKESLNNQAVAMPNDTYGANTPQALLNLFVEALRKKDLDLASKYFELPAENQNQWKDFLNQNLPVMDKLIQTLPNYATASQTSPNYYLFIYKDSAGTVNMQITMHFFTETGLWKIESLQ